MPGELDRASLGWNWRTFGASKRRRFRPLAEIDEGFIQGSRRYCLSLVRHRDSAMVTPAR